MKELVLSVGKVGTSLLGNPGSNPARWKYLTSNNLTLTPIYY